MRYSADRAQRQSKSKRFETFCHSVTTVPLKRSGSAGHRTIIRDLYAPAAVTPGRRGEHLEGAIWLVAVAGSAAVQADVGNRQRHHAPLVPGPGEGARTELPGLVRGILMLPPPHRRQVLGCPVR